MTQRSEVDDALVIGGGFYGAAIAIYLARSRGLRRITLLERESALLTRASYNNQARVHNGYHYPRSFTTAFRSRVNLPKFVHDWPRAVHQDFTKLYAIARRHSKVTPKQFQRFCEEIGADLQPAPGQLAALFEPRLVAAVYMVQEYAFDATTLASWAIDELHACGVKVHLGTTAEAVEPTDGHFAVQANQVGAGPVKHSSRFVFNCTYSGLNQLRGPACTIRAGLKHEISEMALVEAPAMLRNVGITVMDGPFFSMMPFPSRGLHTLSHVRYTPHASWIDNPGTTPYQVLARYPRHSRYERMLRDAARYLPALSATRQADSLFEVKTVLTKNEGDDGRPILFEHSPQFPGFYSVLGGKIDNIYDIYEKLDAERFSIPQP
nr:FAD-dependent oxidoreductase [Variovorax boronicumulans]